TANPARHHKVRSNPHKVILEYKVTPQAPSIRPKPLRPPSGLPWGTNGWPCPLGIPSNLLKTSGHCHPEHAPFAGAFLLNGPPQKQKKATQRVAFSKSLQ